MEAKRNGISAYAAEVRALVEESLLWLSSNQSPVRLKPVRFAFDGSGGAKQNIFTHPRVRLFGLCLLVY